MPAAGDGEGPRHRAGIELALVTLAVLAESVFALDRAAKAATATKWSDLKITMENSGKTIDIEAPLPADFATLLDVLRTAAHD